ncbi:hypothetical protein BN14_04021 [Rhizoctonia solani AG-1 IB]|uniref:Uncharacterized protein n=1 Tax=Thanatephorus cucumeris (strain AG1-IB / isolate 7/3/14) TaxID=1108050 RepID=M5C278_THACB|nr:hypothetical protein BN14_04021 [Rhizoctonia solani AG-1 IB]
MEKTREITAGSPRAQQSVDVVDPRSDSHPLYPTPDEMMGREDLHDNSDAVSATNARSENARDKSHDRTAQDSTKVKPTLAEEAAPSTGQKRKQVDDKAELVADRFGNPTKKRKSEEDEDEDEDEEDELPTSSDNIIGSSGQRKKVLAWMLKAVRSNRFSRSQADIVAAMEKSTAIALANAEIKAEWSKAGALELQKALMEQEAAMQSQMTPFEHRARESCEKMSKELEMWKLQVGNREAERLQLQAQLTEANARLEKEKAHRILMETKLAEAQIKASDKAFVTGR